MNCKHCNEELRKSLYRTKDNQKFKSCPECSGRNGDFHVYKRYPDAFGETPLRASDNNPHGPQSYCMPCRGRKVENGIYLCSDFK